MVLLNIVLSVTVKKVEKMKSISYSKPVISIPTFLPNYNSIIYTASRYI